MRSQLRRLGRLGSRGRTAARAAGKGRAAFTLTELLVVIGLIVLLVTLAVPAFNIITGGRSIDAAENQASAFLGRVRQDALALQEPRGVLMMQDQNTGRVVMIEVFFSAPVTNPARLEVVPERDEFLLPNGIGGQVVTDGGNGAQPFLPTGVILFDGAGQLLVRKFDLTDRDPTGALNARLAGANLGTQPALSQFGFALYDQAAFNDNSSNTNWVRDNAVPFLVNRYNGTLMRGE